MDAEQTSPTASMPEDWPVVVIGAGAAGMLAAARTAMLGHRTLLLEKNRKLGVKILISGGTRCNVTHSTDARGIAERFPKNQSKFLRSALATLPPSGVLQLLREQGIATKTEPTGKIFPASDRAIDVRDAFAATALQHGVFTKVQTAVDTIEHQRDHFLIVFRDGQLVRAASLIIACGGQSYPGCGTSGDGYQWAAALGHSVVPPVPALTPIQCPSSWLPELAELSGLTMPDARLTVIPRNAVQADSFSKKAIMHTDQGSLLFTHGGLSGPVALNVSRTISRHPQPHELVVLADFFPHIPVDTFREQLSTDARNAGRKQMSTIVGEQLPRSLTATVLRIAHVPHDRRGAEISKRELLAISQAMKACPIEVAGTAGFLKAEVTAGGVCLDEVDSRTMQSKRVPNLYFAGEVLDIDGPIGGFNFQAAFSTGWLAAESIAQQAGN